MREHNRLEGSLDQWIELEQTTIADTFLGLSRAVDIILEWVSLVCGASPPSLGVIFHRPIVPSTLRNSFALERYENSRTVMALESTTLTTRVESGSPYQLERTQV